MSEKLSCFQVRWIHGESDHGGKSELTELQLGI